MVKRKIFSLLGMSLLTLVATAANLIVNSDLELDRSAFPLYWMPLNHGDARIDYFPEGGPQGKGFFRLSSQKYPAHIQQNNLKLIPGEKYRISVWVRTENLADKKSGFRVGYGSAPEADPASSLISLPVNQRQWRRYSKEITVSQKTDPVYTYYTVDATLEPGGGILDFCGLTLEPVSEKAVKESLSAMDNMTPSLVPLGNLYYMNTEKPEMEFFWVGPRPGKEEELLCEFSFSKSGKSCRMPFSAKRFVADFKGMPAGGEEIMQVKVLAKEGGKTLYEESYPIRSMEIPSLPADAKKLNNMVTELYAGDLAAGKDFTVVNPRYGFVLFRYEARGKFQTFLDGKPLFDQKSPQAEVVRALDPGKYTFKAEGESGRLTVRLIPSVLTFALSTPRMSGNGVYTWNFGKKYMFPGLTTLNVGGISPAQKAEFDQIGREYLDNYGIQNWNDPNKPEDDLKRLREDKVFSAKYNHGTTLDEAETFYPPMLDPYAWALKRFENPNNKLMVTYQAGILSPAYLNEFSAAANTSRGRGWLATEVYPRGQDSLKAMENMLHNTAIEWQIIRGCAPGLFSKAGVVWGNFSCPPNISLAHYPDVDYKVVLDMKMHAVANDPAFDGLGHVGFWGTYAADEEIVRWSFRLMRHYAFEGKKEMLSPRYGFSFQPGFLKNSDFTDGLKHWNVSGDVISEKFAGYGKRSLAFHGSQTGAGDEVALFRRSEKEFGEISQQAKGLVPGKKYRLYFYVGDADDIINDRQRAGALALDCKIDGAEIVKKTHYIGDNTKVAGAYPNIHKIIFTAKQPEVTLTFSNKRAAVGSQLVLNYVSLQPYFETEELK